MTNIDEQIDKPFIFWLFDWGYKTIPPRLRITPRYVRCDINSKGILIDDDLQSLHIPLTAIEECELYRLRGVKDASGTNLRIKFTLPTTSSTMTATTNEIFLLPVDVFWHYSDIDEMRVMLMMIQAFRNGEPVSLDRNPYHRKLIRQNKPHKISTKVWDPTLPPSHYSPARTLERVLFTIVLVIIGVTIVGMITAGIIFYLVTEVF